MLQCDGAHCIPAGLGGMSSLCHLTIDGAALVDLPSGPYLSRLETLYIQDSTYLAGVPVSLAAAACLYELDLEGEGFKMTDANIAILSSLPALDWLGLVW